jgi:uncharacterized protein
VIAVDTNVLVHAHRRDAPLYGRCAAAMRQLAEGTAAWALPWACVHEFLAIVTHPRIFDPPSPLEAAIDQVAAWLESPAVVPLGEEVDHWERLTALLEAAEVVGPRVHDARVAAVCLSGGVRELWTFDRDFSRFPQLVTTSPPG